MVVMPNAMSTKPQYHPIVRHTSHPLKLEVQSSSSATYHFVDLAANHYNGSCTCPHFWMRLEKLIKREGHAASDRTRCKHIIAARSFFCQVMIRAVDRDIAKTNPRMNRQEY